MGFGIIVESFVAAPNCVVDKEGSGESPEVAFCIVVFVIEVWGLIIKFLGCILCIYIYIYRERERERVRGHDILSISLDSSSSQDVMAACLQ